MKKSTPPAAEIATQLRHYSGTMPSMIRIIFNYQGMAEWITAL
jgi:hypothetical protein